MANPNFGGDKIIIRKLADGSLAVFGVKRAVYVLAEAGTINNQRPNVLVFNSWFAPRGFYRSNFRPFCEIIKRRKRLTTSDIIRIGIKYDLSYSVGRKMPDLLGRKIEFVSERGGWQRKITEDYYTPEEKKVMLRRIVEYGKN